MSVSITPQGRRKINTRRLGGDKVEALGRRPAE